MPNFDIFDCSLLVLMFAKIKYSLFFYFIILGIAPLASVLIAECYHYTEALKSRSFEQLKTVRGIKKREVENYFSRTREELMLFAQSKTIIEAMKAFKKSFQEIKKEDLPKDYPEKLKSYYLNEFRNNVNAPDKDGIDFLSLIPSDPKSVLLQTLYLISNKSQFTPLPYHAVHDRFHSALSDFIAMHGYYDLLLIDDETGHIVYSVEKEPDFATSLLTDAYANSNMGKLFRKIRFSGVTSQAILCDFERYLPSYLSPASFMATPIFDGEKKIGTLIVQIAADKIDDITTNKKIWREEGLGETGECYIIGKDCKLRTNSRFIIESPLLFYKSMENNHYNPTLLSQMKFYKTTILFQVMCNESVVKSSANQTGLILTKDYRGIEVLSAYTHLKIDDVNWSLLAEMDTSEAFSAVDAYKKRAILIGSGILVVLLISVAFISRSIYLPINELAKAAGELGKGNLNVKTKVNTRDELKSLSDTFNFAVASLRGNRDEMLHQNQILEEQKEEIQSQSEKLRLLNEEIMEVNSHLDQKVAERTSELRRQNKKLIEYAFINSHKLRAPVATILGLLELIKVTTSVEDKLKYIGLLEKSTQDLDKVIHEIQQLLKEAEFNDES